MLDDKVKYAIILFIGCMYSMAAFGPVLGFLLGAYLLSFHMDSFSGTIISIGEWHYLITVHLIMERAIMVLGRCAKQ